MALRLLIAHPDSKWLESTKQALEEKQYLVDVATKGRDAQLAFFNNTYFTVILDMELKNHSGAQVLKYIQSKKASQKLILIAPGEEYLPSYGLTKKKMDKTGIENVLFGEISSEQLELVLEGEQNIEDIISRTATREGTSEETEVQAKDGDFTKIRIEEFVSGKSVLFDVYVRLSENRYVKILHAGDTFDRDRVKKYQDKNVEYLYFTIRDRKKFISYANYTAPKIINNVNVPTGMKMNFMRGLNEKIVDAINEESVRPQLLEQAQLAGANMYNFLEKEKNLYDHLRSYNDRDPTSGSHGHMVSVFACMIAKQFDWNSNTLIETIALACILHDIGKTKLPKELMHMSPDQMNEEQKALYDLHPDYGYEILSNNTSIPSAVKQIVLQHHENCDGTGPKGLRAGKILTMSKIVRLADVFVRSMEANELTPVAALRELLSDESAPAKYNSKVLEALAKVFIDPEKVKELEKFQK